MDFSKSRAPAQTCQIWPTFGELVLGCIEADLLRENVFCSIFEALQELRTFALLQLLHDSKRNNSKNSIKKQRFSLQFSKKWQ